MLWYFQVNSEGTQAYIYIYPFLGVSTTNWHLPRALPMTEQRHLPSASAETEPCAAAAVDLQHPLEGIQDGVRHLCSRKSGGTGLQIVGGF